MRRGARQEEIDQGIAREYAGRVLIGKGTAFVLMPILCGVPKCRNVAILIDCFAPFFNELSRCREHAPAERKP